jgi:hypothetical protein
VTPDDVLDQLQAWYLEQCDGEWELDGSIRIDTIENPGWSLTVDLEGTAYAGLTLDRKEDDAGEADWIHWWSDGSQFHAYAGPAGLTRAVHEFLLFVHGAERQRDRAIDE